MFVLINLEIPKMNHALLTFLLGLLSLPSLLGLPCDWLVLLFFLSDFESAVDFFKASERRTRDDFYGLDVFLDFCTLFESFAFPPFSTLLPFDLLVSLEFDAFLLFSPLFPFDCRYF